MTISDGQPRTATSTFTQPPISDFLCLVQVKCYFVITETAMTIRDGQPRTATSTFTQPPISDFLCLVQVLLCNHRDRDDY